jgi:hypothetical protein
MKKHKFLFAVLLLAMASFCRPSPAQTTECGTDSGCFAHYTKITKTSPIGNICTNGEDTYSIHSDVRTGEFQLFSITVEGAAFSIDGQQYLPGQWVDFVGATVSKNKLAKSSWQ